jgi:hypothetical protein
MPCNGQGSNAEKQKEREHWVFLLSHAGLLLGVAPPQRLLVPLMLDT